MIRKALLFIAAVAAAATTLSHPAGATTLSYSTGLANPAVVLDFSGLQDGSTVGAAYAAQGVTFGGLFVSSQLGNTLSPTTAPAAVNFQGNTTNATFTISFTTVVHDAAFFLYTDGFGTTITSSLAGTQVETVNAGTYQNSGADFFGFTASSFDLITIVVARSGNAVIDNVEIGQAQVPEPASAALLLMGLTGIAASRRRRTL